MPGFNFISRVRPFKLVPEPLSQLLYYESSLTYKQVSVKQALSTRKLCMIHTCTLFDVRVKAAH